MSEEKMNSGQKGKKELNVKQDTVNIKFNHQELQVIINLLDVAVRARGLDVAGNAAVIHEKIKEAVSKS